jgi:putative heme iron utilization protein
MRAVILFFVLTVVRAFVPPTLSLIHRPSPACLSSTTNIHLSAGEHKIYQFLQELHTCGYPFRTIVAGNGAILESTQTLGPAFKVTESHKTGDLILTMASADQSFEFHVKLEQVQTIALVERELPGKMLRIIRMTNDKEQSMCSLILAEYSDDAGTFFQGLVDKYGKEFQPYAA